MKLLILGANGLLGNTLIKYFFNKTNYQTFGLTRDYSNISSFKNVHHDKFILLDDVFNFRKLENKINDISPDLIINCIGITNKLKIKNYLEKCIKINSLFPHKLYQICSKSKARLIHFSSDCVFSGDRGFYDEKDNPDPIDIYGRSKLLGELDCENSITIRKSVIGHELISKNGLLEWFLDRNEKVEGYRNVFFSGLTVLELARIIDMYIIPRKNLKGIFHLAGYTISKYELLRLIASEYQKSLKIIPNKLIKIDRSLNSSFFNSMTGYEMRSWPQLIKSMREFDFLN